MNNWIQTYSKIKFDALNPTPDMIDIRDIARGLALTCRFTGQCKEFYSVAQHSYYVSKLIEKKIKHNNQLLIKKYYTPEFYKQLYPTTMADHEDVTPLISLCGLLHDASEAYIGDIPSPIKRILPEYQEMEKKIMGVVCEKFSLPQELPKIVKEIDSSILTTEANYLMVDIHPDQPQWEYASNGIDFFFQPTDWKRAEKLFLIQAQNLGIYNGIL